MRTSDTQPSVTPSSEVAVRGLAWEAYVVAQAREAVFGMMPAATRGVGVVVTESDVRLVFSVVRVSESELEDIEEVRAVLADLLGNLVAVEVSVDVTGNAEDVAARPGVLWFASEPR